MTRSDLDLYDIIQLCERLGVRQRVEELCAVAGILIAAQTRHILEIGVYSGGSRGGGRGGIRTHGGFNPTLDFESSASTRTQPPFLRFAPFGPLLKRRTTVLNEECVDGTFLPGNSSLGEETKSTQTRQEEVSSAAERNELGHPGDMPWTSLFLRRGETTGDGTTGDGLAVAEKRVALAG